VGLFDEDVCLPAAGGISDRLGFHLAEIRHEDGRAVLRDPMGNHLGTYDPRQDLTFDPAGNVLGRGNRLLAILGLGQPL
jgi:hypothetical protein